MFLTIQLGVCDPMHYFSLFLTILFGVYDQIISKVSLPWTLDVHPTKPWIMTTQGDNHVHVWDYDTKKAKSIAIKGKEVTSAIFIACKQWIVAGCSNGLIYVYSYDPMMKNLVVKIKVLQQHLKSVNSLAVHTNMPYVLSASRDGKILIWNYENDWQLIRTIVPAKSLPEEQVEFYDYGNDPNLMKKVGAKSLSVEKVAFPKETDMFASAQDKSVKIWDLGSGKCKHILSGHSDFVVCLDYFSLGGKLHLITGSQDKTAKIWDCETKKCVGTLKGHMDVVKVACCHPDLQILITGSRDGSVRLWNSKTFRHERTLKLYLGEVYAIASLKRSTRIAIANEKGLALVEIGLKGKKDDSVTIMGSKKDKGRMIVEISSSTVPGELIKVDPLQLRFPVGKTVSSKLKICNITDSNVAFSVYSNNNTKKCTVLPSRGVLPPQKELDVLVTFSFRGKHKSFRPNEVFTVKSTVVKKSLKTTYVTHNMFKTETDRNVQHVELVAVFDR